MKKCYVIAVVGSGGKTSLIHRFSRRLRDAGKKTVVVTTTHMWVPEDFFTEGDVQTAVSTLKQEGLVYFGKTEETADGLKMIFPGKEAYEALCAEADMVLLEADGSKCLPLKCPDWSYEPVIPVNVDAVFVVCGLSALGKPLKTVCHRSELALELLQNDVSFCPAEAADPLTDRSLVTADMIEILLYRGYIKPLIFRFPNALISLFFNQADTPALTAAGNRLAEKFRTMGIEGKVTCSQSCQSAAGVGYSQSAAGAGCSQNRPQRISVIYLASGFGRRFGANKLVRELDGKPLYRHGLDLFLRLQADCEAEEGKAVSWRLSVSMVSQYQELLEAGKALGITTVENREAAEGIAASVRLGTAAAAAGDADYYLFSVADQPWMKEKSLKEFLSAFFASGKKIGCMVSSGNAGNPAIFHSSYKKELLSLTGDTGAGRLRKLHREDVFEFAVPEEELRDIDTDADADTDTDTNIDTDTDTGKALRS